MNKDQLSKLVFQNAFDDENLERSDSSSDEDDVLVANIVLQHFGNRKRVCINNYLQVIKNYTEKEFLQHFRLSRQIVQGLIKQYEKSSVYLNLIKNGNSRSFVLSPEKTILIFLWYAGHQTASYRDVADRFDVCLRTLYDIISRLCEFLETIAPQVIKWPSDQDRVESKNYFTDKKGFPSVIGCIDSTHVKIDKPINRHTDYCNRKGYYSIILQAICNEKKRFINIFIGYPGSTHDARVFKNSTISAKLANTHNDFYILGDTAYPLLPYLMTPYKDNGHLSADQKYFNQKLSSARVFIEHSFGMLKQRFRQLYHLKLQGHERICRFIRACCILHNLGSDIDFEVLNIDNPPNEEQPHEEEVTTLVHHHNINLRNELSKRLYNLRNN